MRPLDPVLASIAEQVVGAPSLFDLSPATARAVFSQIQAARKPMPEARMQVDDRVIPSDAGSLRVRVYRPEQPASDATIVYLHGGGYMLGNVDDLDQDARQLSVGTRSVVVSVDYRLAPENRLPAGYDDALTALHWARLNVLELGGDAAQLCVAGESAGANLAASAAVAMRDLGWPLCLQLLIVPAPDLASARALCAADEPSHPMLTHADVRALIRGCLPQGEDVAARFPYSARYASDLCNLPPAVIGVAGHCPLQSIGREYAQCLAQAGNTVRFHCFDDLFHPFFAFASVSEAAAKACEALYADVRSLLAGPSAR